VVVVVVVVVMNDSMIKHHLYGIVEIIAFKIPNQPIDRREGRFFTNWDKENNRFVLQLFFLDAVGAAVAAGSSS
jgi:hypothetical protein